MTWTRLFLVIEGLFFAVIGGWTLLDPNAVARVVDIALPTPSATVDFMTMYGGSELGYGAFLVWCAVRKAYLPAGLLSLVFGVGAATGARILGMATQGPVKPALMQALTFEVGTVLLAGLFLRYVLRQVELG
jgi:hypothetical protein